MSTTTNSTTNFLTINEEKFFSISEAEKYIVENNLDLEDYIDLDAMIETNSTLVEAEIINSENSQRTITCYIDSDDVDYETSKIELTVTTSYHNWHNTVADKIAYEIDKQSCNEDGFNFDGSTIINLDEDLLLEYNEFVHKFNQYGERGHLKQKMTADQINELLYN